MTHEADAAGEGDASVAKRTLRVNAPREKVYEFATDPRNVPAYGHGVQRVEPITSSRHGVGTQWRQTNVFGPVVVVNVHEVVEAERPSTWVVETTTRPHALLTYAFEQTPDGDTDVTLEIEAEMPLGAAGQLAQPLVGEWATDVAVRRTLENLKRKVERERARDASRRSSPST